MSENNDKLPLLLIPLLKGVIYRDESPVRWQELLEHQGQLQDYLSVIGLEMVMHEDEGFVFLRNIERGEDEDELPQLVAKRQLSFTVSLLLAQLRRRLTEHDASSGEERLVLDREEIVTMMATFFVTGSNEVKFRRKIDGALQKILELGFIRFMGEKKEKLEVKRIIKAFVDAQWLSEFDARIKEYREYATGLDKDDAEVIDE